MFYWRIEGLGWINDECDDFVSTTIADSREAAISNIEDTLDEIVTVYSASRGNPVTT